MGEMQESAEQLVGPAAARKPGRATPGRRLADQVEGDAIKVTGRL